MDPLELARRRRRWLILAAASVAAGYGVYRLYHHPYVVRKRITLARLAGTLDALADAAAFSADSIALVSADLNRYLRFGGEIPPSLRQMARLAGSGEVSASLSRVSQAVTLGVLLGYRASSPPDKNPNPNPSFSDRVLDKLFSNPGSNFASAVAGSFAKNLMVGFYTKDIESNFNSNSNSNPPTDPNWVRVVCTEPCKEAISDCIRVFVSTAVAVFLDKTMHINTYDELFKGLTNPNHESKMKEMIISVCNGAVETLVKTSHGVLTQSDNPGTKLDTYTKGESSNRSANQKGAERNGWVDTVSSTLAVPSNRKFVLDVTGRVTFETVRSFLEFVLWKVLESVRTGAIAVKEEVYDLVKYISAKSMIIVTVCVTLCMQVMAGTRFLVPA